MAEFQFDVDECEYDDLGPRPSKNWMQTSTKSISKLQDVKKTFYRLGGGPREREVSCECNYRSKSKSSYLSLETKPPEVKIDSQRSSSLSDLTVPRLLKEYSERQTQQRKVKRRPHSAIVVPTRGVKNNSKPEESEGKPGSGAFISVKGSTVSCQPRPPPGAPPPATNSTDTGTYKGIIHYDRQLIQDTERAAVEGLKKYSVLGAVYDDAEELSEITLLAPRASPEPNTEGELATSIDSNDESLYSEDDVSVDMSTRKCESQSSASTISRPMVFEIPTGDVEDLSDDDDDDEVCSGRDSGRLSQVSQDYIAKSGAFLSELEKQQETEAAEISEMFTDMEQATKKVAALRPASMADIGLETPKIISDDVCGHSGDGDINGNFVPVKQVPLVLNENHDEMSQDQERHFEPYWVEIPSVPTQISSESNMYNHNQNGHIKTNSARNSQFSANRRVQSATVRRHQSETSFNQSQCSGYAVLGKTITFLNSEELLSRGRVTQAPCRRRSEPQVVPVDCPDLEVQGGARLEKGKDDKTTTEQEKKVIGKPPRPSSGTTKKKSSKHSPSRRNRTKREDQNPAVEEKDSSLEQEEAPPVKIHVAIKPSLKKTISESCAALLADFLPQTQLSDREMSENESPKPLAVRKTVSFNLAEQTEPLECQDTKISEEKLAVSNTSKKEEKVTVSNTSKDESTSEVSDEKPLRSLLTKKNIETKCKEEPFPPPRYHYYTLPAGIIIQNGSEVREPNGEIRGSPAGLSTNMVNSTSVSKVKQNISKASRARILAKVKEAAMSCDCSKSECHCRSVTRPTKAVITEAKEIAENLKGESQDDECTVVVRKPRVHSASPVSQREKLLKQRMSRPSSAPIRRGDSRERSPPSPPLTMHRRTLSNRSRPRSASAGHKRSNSDGIKSNPRPSSAHIKRSTGSDARRNRAAVKVLKEGYLFKERPPPPLPPGRVPRQRKKAPLEDSTNEPGFEWGKGEENLVASEECEEVYNRMKEKGVRISMETIKRGLMAPARRASDLTPVTTHQFVPTTGLLSRPETWQPLAGEFARIKVWDEALKNR